MAGAFIWDYQKGELVEGEVLIDLSYAIFSKTQSDWQAVKDAAHPGIRCKDESNEWDWVQKFAIAGGRPRLCGDSTSMPSEAKTKSERSTAWNGIGSRNKNGRLRANLRSVFL